MLANIRYYDFDINETATIVIQYMYNIFYIYLIIQYMYVYTKSNCRSSH